MCLVRIVLGIRSYMKGYRHKKKRKTPKAEVGDAGRSTYYINPKNGNTRYFNSNAKVQRWAYQRLRSFKFKFLDERSVLWGIIMWTITIGGDLVSLSGVWLGFRNTKRKFKKLKQYICSK